MTEEQRNHPFFLIAQLSFLLTVRTVEVISIMSTEALEHNDKVLNEIHIHIPLS